MTERVCIYNRCSTEEESQKNALEVQAQESVEIANKFKNWTIIDQFIESQSGTTVKGRSKYQAMIDGIEQKKYTIIMIKSIDRLTRNTMDWFLFLDCITRNSVKLYIYMENKFYTPEDSIITGLKAMLAADYSRELSKKIKNAHKRRQLKQSGLNISCPMFGWDKVSTNVYVINEEEANILKEACNMIEDGIGFNKIAKQMYKDGVRSKNGKMISATQWRKMIRSTRMYGTVILHQYEYDFDEKKRKLVPEENWIYIEDALPPIVTKEYHDKLLEILDKRNETCIISKVPNKTGDKELSGKIICGECGNKFYSRNIKFKDGVKSTWICSTYATLGKKTPENIDGCSNIIIVEDTLKELIVQAYKEKFNVNSSNNDDIIDKTLQIVRKTFKNKDNSVKISKLRKEIEKIEKNKNKAFDKLMDGTVSDEEYKLHTNRYNEQLDKLNSDLTKLETEMKDAIDYEQRLLDIKKVLKETNLIYEAAKEDIVEKVEKIVVSGENEIEITFNKYKMFGLGNYNIEQMGNMDDLYTAKVLYIHQHSMEKKMKDIREKVKQFVDKHGKFTTKQLEEELGLTQSQAYTRLRELKEEGDIVYKREVGGGIWYSVNAVEETDETQKIKQKIIDFIIEHEKATTKEIVNELNISKNAVSCLLSQLKKDNSIRFIKDDEAGHWYFVNKNGTVHAYISNKQRVSEYLAVNKYENVYKICEDLDLTYDVVRKHLKELKEEGKVVFNKKLKVTGAWCWIDN